MAPDVKLGDWITIGHNAGHWAVPALVAEVTGPQVTAILWRYDEIRVDVFVWRGAAWETAEHMADVSSAGDHIKAYVDEFKLKYPPPNRSHAFDSG